VLVVQIVDFCLDMGVIMDKSVKGTIIVCVTVLAAAGMVTYGMILFGQSLESASYNISHGMTNSAKTISNGLANSGSRVSFPSNIHLQLSSKSIESVGRDIEKASKNISNGLVGATVQIPSEIKLDLNSSSNTGVKVNLLK
jgi:hypothetical protein